MEDEFKIIECTKDYIIANRPPRNVQEEVTMRSAWTDAFIRDLIETNALHVVYPDGEIGKKVEIVRIKDPMPLNDEEKKELNRLLCIEPEEQQNNEEYEGRSDQER